MKLRPKFKSSVLAPRNQPDLVLLTNQLNSLVAQELWLLVSIDAERKLNLTKRKKSNEKQTMLSARKSKKE